MTVTRNIIQGGGGLQENQTPPNPPPTITLTNAELTQMIATVVQRALEKQEMQKARASLGL